MGAEAPVAIMPVSRMPMTPTRINVVDFSSVAPHIAEVPAPQEILPPHLAELLSTMPLPEVSLFREMPSLENLKTAAHENNHRKAAENSGLTVAALHVYKPPKGSILGETIILSSDADVSALQVALMAGSLPTVFGEAEGHWHDVMVATALSHLPGAIPSDVAAARASASFHSDGKIDLKEAELFAHLGSVHGSLIKAVEERAAWEVAHAADIELIRTMYPDAPKQSGGHFESSMPEAYTAVRDLVDGSTEIVEVNSYGEKRVLLICSCGGMNGNHTLDCPLMKNENDNTGTIEANAVLDQPSLSKSNPFPRRRGI